MKINGTSNNSFQNKVLIDTFIEQISALQTDVGNLQIADDNLAQALATKANTADINNAVNTGTLGAQTGNIKTLKVQGTGSSATIENATIGTASIGTETVTDSTITTLHVTDEHAGTVRTGTLTVENDATISGDVSVQDVSAKDITSASVNTHNITVHEEADINKIKSRNAEITGKLEVNDLEVSGNFTGVSNIEAESVEAESVTTNTAEIETLDVENIRGWVTQVMRQDRVLNPPSPALGNPDRYTIELPKFTGVFLLSWEDGTSGTWSEEQGAYITEPGNVIWSATVIGNGKSYGISWGSRTDQNYITDLFQYNGKLYIRINSNGALKYAYSATKELDQIVIYRNMNGWTPDKSLEELCDELSHIQNVYPTGTAWLGPVYIPRLLESNKGAGVFNFKGSCTFANIPTFEDVLPGDVWNITDEAYTDNRFVEGTGKPINAGDDVVAVIVDSAIHTKQATPALYANGDTWYCDGTSVYKNSVDVTPYGVAQNFNLYVCNNTVWLNGDSKLYKYNLTEWTLEAEDCTLKGFYGNNILIYFFYTGQYKTSDVDNVSWLDFNGPQTSRWNPIIKAYINDTLFFSDTDSDGGCIWWGNGTDNWNTYEPSSYDINIKSIGNNVFFVGNIPEAIEIFDWNTNQFVSIDADYTKVAHSVSLNNKGYYGGLYESTDGLTWTNIGELPEGATITDPGSYIRPGSYMSGYSKLYAFDGTTWYEVILTGEKLLKWDKFAAGVNYDNFVADNITATESLKSEGTFEVDGVSTFNNNITQTGNYTATGNLNRTGNETIIGTVVIGDLD